MSYLAIQPFYENFQIGKHDIGHPAQAGFGKSLGELKGQLADWRKSLPDSSCIHVLEYAADYTLHRDKRNPNTDLIGHLVEDAPHWLIVIGLGIAIGVGAEYAWSRDKGQSTQ